ncbi:formate dehydrogenase accessory sulfurtransferase FdhD [Tersicoccus sp. Bi-70]|uniref:formate dehydrogenase accessory sulfurtransferase FdhD n=1 Tax=Tersicoccus sp. Bi-70 TaxID=1897634 RepID=UPI000975A09C|nr:formate dehydrogenase accessory sulfurtransferase FdhD [Tersicoccus sp. Bi-70]OMH32453.1 sufurtransferase FdhD [Tersicoccus sp. Bi-70]
MVRASRRRRVTRLRVQDDGAVDVDARADTIAGEEPLELRLNGRPFTVTMRTPGDDFDLAAGFLVSEGVISRMDQIETLRYGPGVDADGHASYNIVEVGLAPGVALPDTSAERHVYTSSSCGICGTASIDAVTKASSFDVSGDRLRITAAQLLALPDALRAEQSLFSSTGGVHAAGLFTLGPDGPELLCLREDVGRHNAVDKVVGWALRQGLLPARGTVLQVSGRASFELVQKAHLAGIPALAAVSAPSSLAVELAEEAGITLAGFSRGRSVNLYTRIDRVVTD